MNHGQDTVSGEVIRSLCDEFESLLGTYHSVTTATGGRYDNPEILLEALIENLRNEVPEPEEEETDEERIKRWKKMDKESEVHPLIQKANDEYRIEQRKSLHKLDITIKNALEDEGDSI